MDLVCTVAGKRNTSVKCNGTKYEIDDRCILRGVSDSDAKRLLASGDYKPFIERTPVAAAPAAPVVAPPPSIQDKLIEQGTVEDIPSDAETPPMGTQLETPALPEEPLDEPTPPVEAAPAEGKKHKGRKAK